MSEIQLTIRDMSAGLRMRLDEINEPAGSFRLMRNARITDRGGVAKRQGISVIGDYDSSGDAVKGLFAFEKADGTDILVKMRGTDHQFLDTIWKNFETGLTESVTGYAPHVFNTDDTDYLYYSSKENGYRRWRGYFDTTQSTLFPDVRILCVGGGGGGGGQYYAGTGGGGAGGFKDESDISVAVGSYAVTVGDGGNGSDFNWYGQNGEGSSVGSLISVSGGGGGGGGSSNIDDGRDGGSGGGAGYKGQVGEGISGEGHDGGNAAAASDYGAGGGGGASEVGADGSGVDGGAGGDGEASDITGSSVTYAGGGGGGGNTTGGTGGAGGAGGGGAGGDASAAGNDATANTGGGGGGMGKSGGTSGDGGSGVVIIRYATADITATGGSITTDGDYKVHTFTSDGTFEVTAVSGGTAIPVSTTLKNDVFYSGTATSVSTTTLDVADTPWATDVWTGFYVRITSGAQSGKVSLISDTTDTAITFDAIAGLSGTPTFEIRQLAVPSSGTILVDGISVDYTGITDDDEFVVSSAPAVASGSSVVLASTLFPENPKGQALDVWLTKILVANIKSAMAKDSSGNDIATSVSRAVYVSASEDGTDFSFSSPRSADEGDIISLAHGGGRVLDVASQEDSVYMGTPNYIEKLTYSQDGNDLPIREPLKPGVGIDGKFIKGKDDIYFFTPAGELTSVGRVADRDATPQSLDIGFPIRRLLNDRVNTNAVGLEWKNRLHLAQRLDSSSTHNDRMLIYNRGTKSFEGDWLLPASSLAVWDGKPCFGTSNGANVMKMYDGEADEWDGTEYSISTEVRSNWVNVTPSGMADQSITGIHFSGYIRGNSQANLYLFTDYSDDPSVTIDFSGEEDDFIYSTNVLASMGQLPLGEQPMASIDKADVDGYRRFRFSVWFPDIYASAISWGWKSSGKNEYIEINQVGFSVTADPLSIAPNLIKT